MVQQTPGDDHRVLRDDELGATSTEYLFLLVFIALVIVGGAQLFGSNLGARFSDGASSVQSAT